MCGRLTQHYTWREIHEVYGLVGGARNIEPRNNIAPTTIIDTVIPAPDEGADTVQRKVERQQLARDMLRE